MLINVQQNNLQGVSRFKNEFWEKKNLTPNEAYDQDPKYRAFVRGFASKNGVGGAKTVHKFFEVRVLEQAPKLVYTATKPWWEDKLFMEQVFWVFQTPITDTVDGMPYQYYALEPMECWRVLKEGQKKFGINPVKSLTAAFIIPTECCQLAWNETSAGYSDHIHYRPKPVKTDEQVNAEGVKKMQVGQLLQQSANIMNNPKWENAIKTVERRISGNGSGQT